MSENQNRRATRAAAEQFIQQFQGQPYPASRKVYIEGALETRKWQDQSGQDRYTTEIRAEQMQMLGSRQGSGGGGESYGGGGGGGYGGGDDFDQAPRQSAPRQAPSRPAPAPQSAPPSSSGGFGGMDDDIPF